jgi:L-asparaginase
MNQVPAPRVALVLTGGTIDSLGASRLDLAFYYENNTRVPPQELVGALPELGEIADVELVAFRRLSSHALTSVDWLELRDKVQGLVDRPDLTAVVITHGTNTLEETAFFLDLTLRTHKPVLLVGAMRPASALGSDSALNLVRAFQVAAEPATRQRGVLVVLNDTIFAARDVTKTATFRVEAFAARDAGPLGRADADGRVLFRNPPAPADRLRFEVAGLTQLPRVDVLVSHVDADGVLVDAAVAAGARGVVSAGTGAGLPTPAERDAYDRAIAAGLVVCQSSRVGSGRVARSASMRERRVVAGGDLQPWKARVLLALALTATTDPESVQQLFDRV